MTYFEAYASLATSESISELDKAMDVIRADALDNTQKQSLNSHYLNIRMAFEAESNAKAMQIIG